MMKFNGVLAVEPRPANRWKQCLSATGIPRYITGVIAGYLGCCGQIALTQLRYHQ